MRHIYKPPSPILKECHWRGDRTIVRARGRGEQQNCVFWTWQNNCMQKLHYLWLLVQDLLSNQLTSPHGLGMVIWGPISSWGVNWKLREGIIWFTGVVLGRLSMFQRMTLSSCASGQQKKIDSMGYKNKEKDMSLGWGMLMECLQELERGINSRYIKIHYMCVKFLKTSLK